MHRVNELDDDMQAPPSADGQADPNWFRAPDRRENLIAAALFVGFAVFFVLLFFVLGGWWFRWVILVLSGVSLSKALAHAADARRSTASSKE